MIGIFDICGYLFVIFFGCKLLIQFLKLLWPFIIGPNFGLTQNPSKLGKWAVVTGSTDGIGKEYARYLAKHGMNVYLLSRHEDKLKAVAKEIGSQCQGVEIRTIQIDFASADFDTYQQVGNQLQNLEIGMLVNNVAMAPKVPTIFMETDPKEIYASVLVNCMSYVMMTRMVLGQMLARNKGAIVNISSRCALAPVPLMNYYSSSKVYVDYFTRALTAEHAESGLIIQTQRPWSVRTNMTLFRKFRDTMPSAAEYVAEVTKTLGLTNSTAGTVGFQLKESILNFGLIPDWLWFWYTRSHVTSARKDYLGRTKKPR